MQPKKGILAVPPPLYYVAAFLLGLLIEHWLPWGKLALDNGIALVVAVVCLAIGFALGPINAIRFLVRRTTLNPTAQPSLLLTQGIYRFSRNPMYAGLFLVYIGVALINRKLWPLATLAIPVFLVQRVIIPHEEEQLERRFGPEYRDYCSRVGRWFSIPQR